MDEHEARESVRPLGNVEVVADDLDLFDPPEPSERWARRRDVVRRIQSLREEADRLERELDEGGA